MIDKLNLNNIKGGPKTTVLGSLLIGLSLYTIYGNNLEMTEYVVHGGILATGITLFFVKDKKDNVV